MPFRTLLSLGAVVLVSGHAAVGQSERGTPTQTRQVTRPVSSAFPGQFDRTEPLIELDHVEGTAGTWNGDRPLLTIFGNGQVHVRERHPAPRLLTATIPAAELQAVVREIVSICDVPNCQTHNLSREIDEARRQYRRPVPGSDAALTVIRVYGEDRIHEVRCHALGLTASQFPHLENVQNLFRAETRLCNVISVVRAGGYEVVQQALSEANHYLLRQMPSASPLSCRHLSFADVRDDGSRYLQFSRMEPASDARSSEVQQPAPVDRVLMVSVLQRPGQSSQISITTN